MLDFGAVKCDLFYVCEASLSIIKLFCEMRTRQSPELSLDCSSKTKISLEAFHSWIHIVGLCILKEIRSLIKETWYRSVNKLQCS